jgi:Zn-dependent peptidase ImmA (M78 family)
MKFKMNEREYEIIFVPQSIMLDKHKKIDDGTGTYLAMFSPHDQKIYIDDTLPKEQVIYSLIHELTHCYIWAYCTTFEQCNEEDICNIHSNCHYIIHKIVEDFKNHWC